LQHTIKRVNGSSDGLDGYRTNLTALFPLMKKVADKSQILWIMQGTAGIILNVEASIKLGKFSQA